MLLLYLFLCPGDGGMQCQGYREAAMRALAPHVFKWVSEIRSVRHLPRIHKLPYIVFFVSILLTFLYIDPIFHTHNPHAHTRWMGITVAMLHGPVDYLTLGVTCE